MRYMMKQKIFSLGDDFTIKNSEGQDVFLVDGKSWSFGHKQSFQDMAGNELCFIEQKVLSWGPTYQIYRSGNLAAVVKKELFTFFKTRFTVDVPGPDDLEAEGDFHACHYRFTRHGNLVAQVSKEWFALSDTYGVDIQPNEDDVLILACTVVIDLVMHDKTSSSL